jgi:hypothetical protein
MSSSHTVDCFINNCRHSTYLTQVSCFDRQDKARSNWFEPGALAVTLNNYLSNPDSPARHTKTGENNRTKPPYTNNHHGSSDRHSSNDGSRPPFQRCMHQLETDDTLLENIDETQMDTFAHQIVAQLHTHDPKTVPTCLLCKDVAHSFDDCPLLKDGNFKTSFIIKMLSLVSRELRNGKKKQQELTTGQRMNQMLTSPTASDTTLSKDKDNSPDDTTDNSNTKPPLDF